SRPAPPELASDLGVVFEPVGCLLVGENSIINATMSSREPNLKLRMFFRSSLASEWFHAEMSEVVSPQVKSRSFNGWLPNPALEAKRVDIYVEASHEIYDES